MYCNWILGHIYKIRFLFFQPSRSIANLKLAMFLFFLNLTFILYDAKFNAELESFDKNSKKIAQKSYRPETSYTVIKVKTPLFLSHFYLITFAFLRFSIFPTDSKSASYSAFFYTLCRWFRFAQLAKGKKFRP